MEILTMKNWTLAICLLTVSLAAWSNELYTPQPVVQGDNKIIVELRFDSPESGDMYLATIINGKLSFLTQNAQGIALTETPSPFRANETF
ncbi:secreted protein, partial [Beggiatoa sp. SS]